MKHQGNLTITKENQEKYNALTEVTGGVYVREGARLTANALTEVTGWVDVQKGARLTANALTA